MTEKISKPPAASGADPSMVFSQPLISVIIPAFGVDLELRRCVDSIRLACGGLPICEILVVMPAHQLSEARSMLPGETVIAESRPSIYAAMNDGVAASSGEYLYFIGKDDIMLAPFSEVLVALRDFRPSAVFCDVYWGGVGLYRCKPSRLGILARNVCHQGVVYSRRALVRNGPYLRKMRVEADKVLNLRLLWDAQLAPAIRYMPIPIAWYSASGFSTVTADPVFRRLYPLVLRRYVGSWAAALLIAVRKLRGR